jgi:hypothetical protein
MKKFFLILTIFFVVSCDTSSSTNDNNSNSNLCSSVIVENWEALDGSTLFLESDESFEAYDSDLDCSFSGTYSCPGNVNFGIMSVNITESDCEGFIPVGTTDCEFSYNESELTFQCENSPQPSYFTIQ